MIGLPLLSYTVVEVAEVKEFGSDGFMVPVAAAAVSCVVVTGAAVVAALFARMAHGRKAPMSPNEKVAIATIAVCYFIEIFVIPQTQPSLLEMGGALLTPGFRRAGMIYVAIGIIGATVMPHNLYLHSALVQSRNFQKDEPSIRRAIKFNTIDSVVSLIVAFFVNAAILVLAAMVFFGKQSVRAGMAEECAPAAGFHRHDLAERRGGLWRLGYRTAVDPAFTAII